MTISPFDHPLLTALLGDEDASVHFSAAAELAAMLDFERALAEVEAGLGVIPADAGNAIVTTIERFSPDTAALRKAAAQDGLVVPELVRQLRDAVGEPHARFVHFGATSQDVVDTGLVLRLKPILAILEDRLVGLAEGLAGLEGRFGSVRLIAVTRMQPAVPISVAARIGNWRKPLERHLVRLRGRRPDLLAVQLGGAAGTLDVLEAAGPTVRAALAARLGLADTPQWHSQRDAIADFASSLSLITASLGKLGQDVALMALGGTIALADGGRSSAMPHKQNPVKAEVLEALARFNAAQVAAMHEAAIHPVERSGSAWMLEWLVLPSMVVATAAALRQAGDMVGAIERMGA
ncbi:3-carboxy-cis,cis-muconate cycloisomerase [Mesorhizobium sp. ZMM04-5]|uniref:3-carboxy-cis,cis-muconate cycloisomerase n=1 Tax=Mesorhizobium marinum TaxID=3228790 RepID=A0ABV3R3U5_9HYPH